MTNTVQLAVKRADSDTESVLCHTSQKGEAGVVQTVQLPQAVVNRSSVLRNVLDHEEGTLLPIDASAFDFWIAGTASTLIDQCHACNVAEFLDDEELPAALCDAARRVTFAWVASGGHESSSVVAAIKALTASLQHRILALIPVSLVLQHLDTSVELQRIALQALMQVGPGGCSASLHSSSCWSAVPEVLFGAVSTMNVTSLTVSLALPARGLDPLNWQRLRCEWLQQLAGLSSLTHVHLSMPVNVISDLSNLIRSLMLLTALQALALDCSGSKLQQLPQPMQATLLPAFPHLQYLSLKCIRPALLGYNFSSQLAHDLSKLPALSSLHFLKNTLPFASIAPLFLLLTGQQTSVAADQYPSGSTHAGTVHSAVCSTLRSLTINSGPPEGPSLPPASTLEYFSNLQQLCISCQSPLPLIPRQQLQDGETSVAFLPSSLSHLSLQQPVMAPSRLQTLLSSYLCKNPFSGDGILTPIHASMRSLEFTLPTSFWELPGLPGSLHALSKLSELQALAVYVQGVPETARGKRRKPRNSTLMRHVRGVLCAAVATLQSLKSLHLSLCALDCPAALAALQQLSKLQSLHLNDSCWRSIEWPQSKPAAAHPLQQVALRDFVIGSQRLADLVHADIFGERSHGREPTLLAGDVVPDALVHLTQLTELNAYVPSVYETPGMASGVTVSAALGTFTRLIVLRIESAHACSDGAMALAGALCQLQQLSELSLIGMQLFKSRKLGGVGEAGAHVEDSFTPGLDIASVLGKSLRKLKVLKTLCLDGNDMSGDQSIVEVVVRGISGLGLEVLSLKGSGVTEEQVHALRIPPKAVVHLAA